MRLRLFALLGAFAVVPLASAQYYQAVILHPVGHYQSFAWAAAPGQQGGEVMDGNEHAAIWSNSASSYIDLNPAGHSYSVVYGTDGVHQAGIAGFEAALWSGTAGSFVSLHPSGAVESLARGVSGNQVVGYVMLDDHTNAHHAALWTLPAGTWTNFDPPTSTGYIYAELMGVGGGQQVGIYTFGDGIQHAGLWSGTAASLVDLTPAGTTDARALSTDGVQQCGFIGKPVGQGYHAYMWSGTAASGVDLDPGNGANYSFAYGVSNGKQVGWYYDAITGQHACVWSGTAASIVDLNQFLPPAQYSAVYATGVASDGTISGFYQDMGGAAYAVLWIPSGPPSVSSGFLQPINDPASPESVFKKGSTVPVKFKLKTSTGQPVSSEEAHISLTQLGAGETLINEQYYETPSDDGTTFHFNTGSGCYEYNLGTKNLVSGARYRITATWTTGSASVTIAIK